MKLLKNQNQLRDALFNFSPASGASDDYCKGLLVGLVSAFMADGMTWRNAITHAAINLPYNTRLSVDSVPPPWLDTLHAEFLASHKAE